jgi:hypothetical protein
MTVDRTHVLATPGMDAHGSYVALSRHRDGMELHYGRDDFAGQEQLVRTLSRDRAKDMASDYEQRDPAQGYAERRGITFRERVAEIVRKVVPEKVRDRIGGMFDGSRSAADAAPDSDAGERPDRKNADVEARRDPQTPARSARPAKPGRDVVEDREAELRSVRTDALKRHARAVDAIFSMEDAGGKASPDQMRELTDARKAFEEVRPHGWRDAETAYAKDADLAREAGSGRVNRPIRALQLETEIRTDPNRRADRFVERWRNLDRASERRYAAGDYSGYKAARVEMGNMAMSLERDAQMESLLRGRKRELGSDFDSGHNLGRDLAISHGLGRGRGIGL